MIEPVLQALGWGSDYLPQVNLSGQRREDVPDILLFRDAQAMQAAVAEARDERRLRHGLALLEAKRWLRALDRGDDSEASDPGAPSSQMLRYLSRADVVSDRAIKWGRRTDGEPAFVEVAAPTDQDLQALLHKIIARLMKLLTRRGVLVEEEGSSYLADGDADSDDARTLRPLQAAPGQWPGPSPGTDSPLDCLCPGSAYRIAFGPRAEPKVFTVQGTTPRSPRRCVPTRRVSACTPPCAAPPTRASSWSSYAATSSGLQNPYNPHEC